MPLHEGKRNPQEEAEIHCPVPADGFSVGRVRGQSRNCQAQIVKNRCLSTIKLPKGMVHDSQQLMERASTGKNVTGSRATSSLLIGLRKKREAEIRVEQQLWRGDSTGQGVKDMNDVNPEGLLE